MLSSTIQNGVVYCKEKLENDFFAMINIMDYKDCRQLTT